MGIFQSLNEEQGITIIFVTHEHDIAEHTRRVVRLADGVIVEDRPILNQRRAGAQGVTPLQPPVTIKGGA
jgi:ABC-type lipoprotein export system ATPase subunit